MLPKPAGAGVSALLQNQLGSNGTRKELNSCCCRGSAAATAATAATACHMGLCGPAISLTCIIAPTSSCRCLRRKRG